MASIRTGIEVTTGRIIAAQVRVTPSGWRMLAGAMLSRVGTGETIDAHEAAALESLLFRRGFSSAPCVVNAPESGVRTAAIALPPVASGAPIEPLARSEFARHHKIDPARFVLSCWPLPGPGPGMQVMALGCDIAPTDQRVGVLEAAGLRVAGVDDSARALGRVVARSPWPAAVRVGARLDPWGAMLVVLHEGVLLYTRRPAGLTPKEADGTPNAETAHALAGEIDACVSFARHRCRSNAPASIGLFGSLGGQTGVREMLAVRYGQSLVTPASPDGSPFGVEYGVAIGLALLEDPA